MPGTTRFRIIGNLGHIVNHLIPCARHKVRLIAQLDQLRICDGLAVSNFGRDCFHFRTKLLHICLRLCSHFIGNNLHPLGNFLCQICLCDKINHFFIKLFAYVKKKQYFCTVFDAIKAIEADAIRNQPYRCYRCGFFISL